MTIPHPVRVGVLVIAATSFYTYVGQMVPQKEVLPPQETLIRADLTTADMVKVGREIMDGKGLCFTCHTIGKTGALRFPDLEGVDTRAQSRVPGLTDIEYFAQSIYEPEKFIVPGFNPGMPVINKPPIGLNDQEILCVIAYLQTLGGKPTVTLQTSHHYYTAPGAPGTAPASAAGSAPGAPPAAPGTPPAAPGTPPAAPGTPPAAPGTPPATPGKPPATPATPPAAPAAAPAPVAPAKGTR
jgi:cytochrome c2